MDGLKHIDRRKRVDFLVNFGGRCTDVCYIITNFITHYIYPFECIKYNFSKVFNCTQSTNRAQRKND